MAATAPLTRRRPLGPLTAGRDEPPAGGERAGAALLVALLAAVLYAAFASGASSYPEEARLQAGLSLIALLAVTVLVWRGRRLTAPPAAWTALGLLGAFAVWSGLSLAWSLAPAETWSELNRAIAYALVLGLALAAGSWYPKAVRHAAVGYAAIALVVALYALGGKVVPGIVVDIDETAAIPRLRLPLEYWNAVALFVVMAVPVVLRLATDETRATLVRLGALVALPVYLVTIGLTYSRGGIIALVVAVVVTLAFAGARLRSLMYLALALAAAAPALAYGLSNDALTNAFVAVSDRKGEGLVLGGILLGSLVLVAIVGRLLLSLETRFPADPVRSRRIGRALAGALVLAAIAGVVAMAGSDRGVTGTIEHQWDTFRSPREAPALLDPGRLASTNAGNRWVWWSEAAGAWSDRPLAGWGAGAFPVLHREYRTNQLDVLQAHSMPLQFLAETGLVGFLLVSAAIGLLLAGAIGTVRRLVPGPERGLAAALLGASAAWAVHSLYDWDWEMPAVTLPAFIFLGLLCARGTRDAPPREALAAPGTGARAAVLAGATLLLATVAISAILPSWAQTKTEGALASVVQDPTPGELEQAQSDADLASRLDPLSHVPLLAASSIADRRGRSAQAREYLMDAIRRAPDSMTVWLAVARFEATRGDARNVQIALRRALELDPRNRTAPVLLASEQAFTVPAASSATATGTPLVAVVGQTPATRRLLPQGLQQP
jgi:O-Antigen ligase